MRAQQDLHFKKATYVKYMKENIQNNSLKNKVKTDFRNAEQTFQLSEPLDCLRPKLSNKIKNR